MSAAPDLTLSLAERLLERSGEGMVALDRHFRCRHWNHHMERLTGLAAGDVLGHDLFVLFPFLREIGEDLFIRRAREGEDVSTRNRPYVITANNRRGFFDGCYGPWRDESGAIIGVIGVINEVTAKRRAAEVLHESESRFRAMADVAPVLLWMSDPDGLCTFFNQTWLSFTGRTQEEEWGVGWAEGVHFEDFQRCMDTYLAAFSRREVFEVDYRLRRHDGEYRWLLDRGRPRYTPDGSFAGYIGSCIDITERRALESELRRAVRARDEFLSVASHELKTPLTSLQLQIESLHRLLEQRAVEALHEGRLHAGTKAVTNQARRLAELIEVLLDVSRINAGRLRFEYSEVNFLDVARDAVDRWRPAAAESAAEITLQEPAPDASDLLCGSWDRLRLEQILNNLLSNAIKYGSGKPIYVGITGGPQRIRFSVTDQGIGIAADDQRRIFQRFERAVPSRNYGGLGLGLWITHEIVTALGGSINVASEPGRGSSFSVELPRQPAVSLSPD